MCEKLNPNKQCCFENKANESWNFNPLRAEFFWTKPSLGAATGYPTQVFPSTGKTMS
jgi:hypothetical protein